MEQFNKYLQQFPNYTPEVFQVALPFISKKNIEAGSYFLNHGKISRSLGFIEKGLFRLFYLNDGKEVTHCFCRENSITTSYRSFIKQEKSDIAIQAIEDSTLLVISYESIQKLYNSSIFWQQLGRIASENEYLITDTHNRMLNDLSATERYLQILENDEELLQRVPLNYLASFLQIAPETLSRIRNKIMRT